MNGSLKWRNAMPSELEFQVDPPGTPPTDAKVLNNSSNTKFIKNMLLHKLLKCTNIYLRASRFFINGVVGKLFKDFCLSRILSLLSRDVG